MEDSSLIRQTFTPMSYVMHQARSLYFAGNFAVEEAHNCTMAEILDDVAVTRLDVVGVGCSAHCSGQMAERVESFINRHKQQSMICFTDAATSEAEVGISSAAVIILSQDTSVKEMEVSEVIPKITFESLSTHYICTMVHFYDVPVRNAREITCTTAFQNPDTTLEIEAEITAIAPASEAVSELH